MAELKRYSHLNRLDRITGAQQILTTDHALIHDGRGYSVDTRDLALADSAYLTVAIKTDPAVYIHMKNYSAWTDSDYCLFTIQEGATITGGTLAGQNRNRVTSELLKSEIKTGVTISAAGAELEGQIISGGSGVGGTSQSGERNVDIEWVLKPDTQYVFKLLNSSGGAAKAFMWVFFYEEDEG